MKPGAVESRRQSLSIELRIVPGFRDRTHVDDPLNSVRLHQADEVRDRPCRVSDREDDKHVTSAAVPARQAHTPAHIDHG
jgi:hypothetical protein